MNLKTLTASALLLIFSYSAQAVDLGTPLDQASQAISGGEFVAKQKLTFKSDSEGFLSASLTTGTNACSLKFVAATPNTKNFTLEPTTELKLGRPATFAQGSKIVTSMPVDAIWDGAIMEMQLVCKHALNQASVDLAKVQKALGVAGLNGQFKDLPQTSSAVGDNVDHAAAAQ